MIATFVTICVDPCLPLPARVQNTRMRGGQANTTLTPTRTSRLVRDHYVKMVHRMVLSQTMDLPALI